MALLTEAQKKYLENCFPNLRASVYRVTSPASPDYNCVAWAMGHNDARWWPEINHHYWPDESPNESTAAAFVAMLQIYGYETCDAPDAEAGFEKLALYARHDREPTHIARQKADGVWTSKLGAFVDIDHEAEALCGNEYGSIVRYLRRSAGVV